ncbi:MAG: PEP-utilizing enzyme [Abditibacteriales bacterium]|nr:PEP-utilizing enzyme [Abditibacteriales bacterium]
MDSHHAARLAHGKSEDWKHIILVREETNPDDLGGMLASQGVLTARGGRSTRWTFSCATATAKTARSSAWT